MSITLSELAVYPLKSCQGQVLSSAQVEYLGLVNDRRFTLIDRNGVAITGRTHPRLVEVSVAISSIVIAITAPDRQPLHLNFDQLTEQYLTTKVWQSVNQGQYCGEYCDQWFSDYLNVECRLVFYGEQTTRQIKDHHQQVSFADGYPVLLIGESSLAELNHHALHEHQMAQFRPNIVVSGSLPFAEDTWQHIAIGEVEFLVHSLCSRCQFTQLNLQTGQRFTGGEPLSVLRQFRSSVDHKVYFGVNLIPLNEGQITLGEAVQVLN